MSENEISHEENYIILLFTAEIIFSDLEGNNYSKEVAYEMKSQFC
jgi:hypothetical protein